MVWCAYEKVEGGFYGIVQAGGRPGQAVVVLAGGLVVSFSALLGIPRSLVYAMAPVSGLFIIVAQIINIYEDVTGITIEGGNEE